MNLRPALVVSGIVVVAQLVLALVGLALVEPGVEVPIHWGVSGEPDDFASPAVAFLFTPVITLGLVGLLAIIPRIEPRAANLARSSNAYRTVWIALVLFMGALQAVVVASGLGAGIQINVVIGVGVGVMFIALGNVMTTIRSNFMFGVRTPWTLTSELSWKKTHRVVGWLFVLMGALAIVASLVAPTAMVWVILGGVVVILVVSFGYSYVVWRGDPDKQDTSAREA
jgi:uncharacterized membrane protein